MSTTIDNRVVEMRFDNAQFEKNASQSISTLERLKQALKFNKSDTSGFDKLEKSAKSLKLDSISDSVDKISGRFSNLGIVGVTALQRITNSAINAGERIVSALTIDPVKTGLSEYETKMGAIQVIRANDQAASMTQISDALNELNTYADKTIYNFAQMTSNVGKFVAQGLGVKEAANAVKGMANLAAASGASASDMARATYQMSQALGGVIRKIDVNSLRNANMWTMTLKNTLMDVARAEGVAIDKMIEEKGTLEETLEEGWLTGEMFTKAMNIYSGVYDEAQLKAMGFNEKQIKNFQNIAKTAEEAAVEVKTFTQLIDTFKESVQSGWTQSWEAIIGNFEEAKALWTGVSQVLETLVGSMADSRNAMLESWKALGGRDKLISAISYAFEHLLQVGGAVKEAFNNVFPPTTGRQLLEITKNIHSFIMRAKPTKEVLDSIYYAVTGVLQVVKTAIYFVKELVRVLQPVTNTITKVLGVVVKLVGVLGYLTAALAIYLRDSGKITQVANVIAKVIGAILNVVTAAAHAMIEFVKAVIELPIIGQIFDSIANGVTKLYNLLSGKFSQASGMVSGFVQSMRNLKKEDIAPYLTRVGQAFEFIWGMLKPLRSGIDSLINSLGSNNSSFGSIAGGATSLLDSLKEFLKGGSIIDSISKKIDSLKNSGNGLTTFEAGFHDFVTKIVQRARELDIARIIVVSFGAAITIQMLNLSRAFSKLPTLMKDIHRTFGELKKTIRSFNQARDSVGDTIIKIAAAIAILAGSVFLLSRIDSGALKSATMSLLALIAVFGILAGAMIAVASIDKIADNFEKASRGVIEIAGSVGILVASLKVLDTMHPMKIEQNMKAISFLIAQMTAVGMAFSVFNPAAKSNAIVMIGFALALYKTVEAVAKLAAFPESQIRAAGDSIAQLMLLLTGLTLAVSKIKFGAGAGLVAIVTSLYLLEGALWTVAKLGIGADAVIQNIDKFIIVFSVLAGLLAMTRLAGANAMGAGVAAMGLGVALLSMSAVLAIMAGLAALNPDALLVGVMGLIGLMGGVWIMMQAVANTEKASLKAGAALVPMSLALILMAGAVKLLSSIPAEALPAGLAAVGILTLFAAGLTAVSEMSAKAKFAPIVAMAAAVIAITGSLALLSMADTQGLGAAAGALMLVLLSFAGAMASATTMVEKINFAAIAGFVTMIGILVASSTALATLANLPWQGLIAAAGAISILMGTMALVGSFAQVGIGTAVALTALSVAMVPLAFALMLLQGVQFEDVIQGIAGLAAALGVLLLAGWISGIAPVTMGLMALIAVMGGFSLSALVFSEALTAITNALVLFAQNGPMITMSITSMFLALGTGINFAITSIGTGLANAVVSFFSTLTGAIIDGIDSIITAITGKKSDIASAGTSLIGGLVEGIISALPGPVQAAISVVGAIGDVFTGGGLVSTLFGAGADAVLGLAEGMNANSGVAEAAGAQVGVSAEAGLRNQVGWHSPWELLIQAGRDAVQGLADGISGNAGIAETAASIMGSGTGNSAINSILNVIGARSGEVDAAIAALMNRARVQVGTEKVAKDVSADSMRDEKKARRQQEKAQKKQVKANDSLAESFANIGGGKGSGGGGGGGGGGAASAAKEIKKLFDVMEDGGKVVQKFAEKVGNAYETAGYTHPLEMGKEAVQKLAEKIYEASVKTVDAETQMAKTSEEKLAEMRDAFIKYQDNIKNVITGQVDMWGGLTQKSAVTTKEWTKNLKTQRMWVGQWEKDLSYAAERLNDENIMSWLLEQGPAFDMQLKKLLSSSEEEFRAWEEEISSLDTLYDDAVNAAMAAYAEYYTKLETNTTETYSVVENTWNGIGAVVWKAGEDHSKVVNEMVDGNKKIGESAQRMATVTKQAIEGAMFDYMSMRDTVKGTVDDQIDLFSKFDTDTELTGDDLHDNMKSQIDGIRDWSAGMTQLLENGLDRGLYQKLAEMGPKSYEYVQAFLQMTSEQLNDANAYFQQSLTLGDEIGQQLGSDFAVAGLMASEGFKQGIDQNAGVAEIKQMALNVVNAFRGDLDIHSPSGVFMGFGQNLDEGLTRGITMYQTGPIGAITTMARLVIERARTEFSDQQFFSIGQNVAQGLARGIESSSSIVTAAAAHVMHEAIAAAEEAAGIASPSKEFARLGRFSDLGLAKGLIDNSNEVDEAATSVANSALNSMRTVVGHIADIINGEVTVDPTIRPVLDLSNVAAGASAMDSMFGGTSYGFSRGINIQNRSDSINDLINQMSMRQAAFATPNGANINMYVYGAQGQSEEELANIIEQKLMFRLNRTGAVWT